MAAAPLLHQCMHRIYQENPLMKATYLDKDNLESPIHILRGLALEHSCGQPTRGGFNDVYPITDQPWVLTVPRSEPGASDADQKGNQSRIAHRLSILEEMGELGTVVHYKGRVVAYTAKKKPGIDLLNVLYTTTVAGDTQTVTKNPLNDDSRMKLTHALIEAVYTFHEVHQKAHLDLKPENVMCEVTYSADGQIGTVKMHLIDFDTVRPLDSALPPGCYPGTGKYKCPEMLRAAEAAAPINPRKADDFSMACVIVEILYPDFFNSSERLDEAPSLPEGAPAWLRSALLADPARRRLILDDLVRVLPEGRAVALRTEMNSEREARQAAILHDRKETLLDDRKETLLVFLRSEVERLEPKKTFKHGLLVALVRNITECPASALNSNQLKKWLLDTLEICGRENDLLRDLFHWGHQPQSLTNLFNSALPQTAWFREAMSGHLEFEGEGPV